ncbi:hypothetical protein KAJ41_01115 [Candidatus Parcubacteria bacterium]|nr:hypothetical protein [Candidatus Parcubacteria bacterium]
MGKWKPTTFKDNGYKDMHCCNCGKRLYFESRLIDKTSIKKKCKECKTTNAIHPPKKATVNGNPVIMFRDYIDGRNPMECTFTADQTQE